MNWGGVLTRFHEGLPSAENDEADNQICEKLRKQNNDAASSRNKHLASRQNPTSWPSLPGS